MSKFLVAKISKYRHGKMLKALEESGLSAKAAAEKLGVGYNTFLRWFRFEAYPKNLTKEQERAFLDMFGYTVEDLFPPELLEHVINKTPRKVVQYASVDILELAQRGGALAIEAPETPHDEAEKQELRDTFDHIIDTLTPKEQAVIRAIYYDDLTLVEAGKRLHKSRERVRQIESEALRKLRSPLRNSRIKEYASEDCFTECHVCRTRILGRSEDRKVCGKCVPEDFLQRLEYVEHAVRLAGCYDPREVRGAVHSAYLTLRKYYDDNVPEKYKPLLSYERGLEELRRYLNGFQDTYVGK